MRTGLDALLVLTLSCAGCVRGPAIEPAQADTKQATQKQPTDAEMLAFLTKNKAPKADIFVVTDSALPDSPAGMQTFRELFFVRSLCSSQISEISICFHMVSRTTGKETYRSKPQKITQFVCDHVPHKGTLTAFSRSTQSIDLKFDIPSDEWTTDSLTGVVISGIKGVADESNLHDYGNLISFVLWHNEHDVEAAFLKDPALFKSHSPEGANPAMVAAATGTTGLVDFMLQHGVELSDKTPEGHDLMYAAVGGQDPEILENVVKRGFSVNERYGKSGRTPLMEAILGSSYDSVKWLLAHGADPNAEDASGVTPLLLSVVDPEVKHSAVFDELIAAKADFRHTLSDGMNLLFDAITFRYQPTVEKLVNLGLDVNSTVPESGMTPLMWSAEHGTHGISKFLLSKGAKLDAVDKKGQTVFDYAKKGNTFHTDEFFRKGIGIK